METESGVDTQRDKSATKPARVVWLLAAAMLLAASGQTFVSAVFPLYGRALQLTEAEIAILLSASSVMLVLATPAWGRLSERLGRRLVLLIGFLGYSIGTAIFLALAAAEEHGLITGWRFFVLLLLSRLLQAGLFAATTPAIVAWISDLTQAQERMKAMGVISACATLGMMSGPMIASALAGFGLTTPFYFFMTTFFIASIALARLPETAKRQNSAGNLVRGVSFFDPRVRIYVCAGVLIFTALALLQFALALYLQDGLRLSVERAAQVAGGALALASGISAVTQLSWGRRVRWSPPLRIRVGSLVAVVGYLVLGLLENIPGLALAMILTGLGMGLVMPAFRAGASLATKAEEQGSVAGLVSACAPIGYVIGPLLGAQLYALGPRAPFVAAALVLVPSVLWRRHERSAVTEMPGATRAELATEPVE